MKRLLISLAISVLACPVVRAATPEQGDAKYKVAPQVPIKAQAFSLHDVRLLDGPFKTAMGLDANYLLDLEPDRLLSRFREYAGLEPKGKVYGGWEARGISGHTLGHYISACSMMYAASGDKRFLHRVNYIVDELALCQEKHGNGYVGGIPEAKKLFDDIAAGKIESSRFSLNGGWVPWYNLHKLYAGLVQAYHSCGNEKAKTVLIGLADWAGSVTGSLSDTQMQKMLECEIGGMNEALADVYAITGKEEHLKLATRFNHNFVLDPLVEREDHLEGLHANTQIPKIIGAARQYELTGNEDLQTAASFFWEVVTQDRSYANGGNSEREHFSRKGELWKRLTASTSETCNTYNMLKLTRHLFAWTADAQYADYYERALYNHILASQDPKKGMTIYFCELKPGHFHTYGTPYDSFWCCTGSGMENHVKYGDSIYFHDDASLFVNLFIASELNWKAKGLKVRQETQFPNEPKTRLVLSCEKPVKLALKIRHPYWITAAIEVAVNGQTVETDSKPGGYLTIDRTWADGDKIDVALPMSLRLERMENCPSRAAIMYGPILLAGKLGRQGFTDEMPYSAIHWTHGGGPTPPVPELVDDGKPAAEWIERIPGDSIEFKTVGAGRPIDVTLIPFYKAHHHRYTVYWDLFGKQEWEDTNAAREAEKARVKDIQERTIDVCEPKKEIEEKHGFKAGATLAGTAFGRNWRHAQPNGWFSYDMKVLPDKPVEVMLTFWGGDTGSRGFDIQIDGTKIGSQTLKGEKPGEFFDVTYKIPVELTKNKEKVTVRFQPHPGKIAGGIYECRIVKRK